MGAQPSTLSLEFLVNTGVVKGEDYTFRYRAINKVGAGPWSAVATVKAAGKPTAPAKPKLIACSATSVTLEFNQTSVDNGGSKILSYKLLRDTGDAPSSAIAIATATAYGGQASQYQVTGLTSGVTYRFQYYATNVYGDSPGSVIISATASRLPDAPGTPTIDWTQSSRTSLFVRWVASSTGSLPESPILGYQLQMDSGNGTFVQVYDGAFKPGILGHLVDGLTNGHLYSFRVIALNYNGESVPGAAAPFYACTAPAQFAKPEVTSQSKT